MSDQSNVPAPSCSGPCPTSPQLQLYQTIIFATPVLFAFLLLVLFCMLCIRRRRHFSTTTSQSTMQFVTSALFPTVHSSFDHGLSRSFRQRLPTVPFDEKFTAASEDNQCAVCLGDYVRDEKLQQLPVCKHAFHVSCIDEWLAKNTTCPICRSSLLQEGSHSIAVALREGENRRESDSRRWEDRVMNEVQEISVHVRPDASSAESNGMGTVSSLESAPRFSIDIERS